MKASVQYNDFKGTAAADISDHTSLSKYLQSNGVDPECYYPIGIDIYHGVGDHFGFSIICQDRQNGNNIVKVAFEDKQSTAELFGLFKRFHVILTRGSNSLDGIEDDPETIYFDNRENK